MKDIVLNTGQTLVYDGKVTEVLVTAAPGFDVSILSTKQGQTDVQNVIAACLSRDVPHAWIAVASAIVQVEASSTAQSMKRNRYFDRDTELVINDNRFKFTLHPRDPYGEGGTGKEENGTFALTKVYFLDFAFCGRLISSIPLSAYARPDPTATATGTPVAPGAAARAAGSHTPSADGGAGVGAGLNLDVAPMPASMPRRLRLPAVGADGAPAPAAAAAAAAAAADEGATSRRTRARTARALAV